MYGMSYHVLVRSQAAVVGRGAVAEFSKPDIRAGILAYNIASDGAADNTDHAPDTATQSSACRAARGPKYPSAKAADGAASANTTTYNAKINCRTCGSAQIATHASVVHAL